MTDAPLDDWREYRRSVLDGLADLKKGVDAQDDRITAVQIAIAKLETRMAVYAGVATFIATVIATLIVRYLAK